MGKAIFSGSKIGKPDPQAVHVGFVAKDYSEVQLFALMACHFDYAEAVGMLAAQEGDFHFVVRDDVSRLSLFV